MFCLFKVSAVNTRLSMLRSVPFFVMDILLKEGKDLVIRDSCGKFSWQTAPIG